MVICRGDGFMHYVGYRKEGITKNVLQVENVDEQNKYGESIIYVATYFCELDVVVQLLNMGANPNIQNMDGNSSLHAAAYIGNLKLLTLLVDSGGDLRIVNGDGQRPCQLFKDIKSNQRIKTFEQSLFNEFVKYIRYKAEPIIIPQRKPSIFDNLTRIRKTGSNNQVHSYFGFQSGFGNYFCQNKTVKGLISSIKVMINSKNLELDASAKLKDFSCGHSLKISNQLMNNYPVSVKVAESMDVNLLDTKLIGLTNQTIKEANILGGLRHPHILLLMAVNLIVDETDPSVMYQLIFERCYHGSIYQYLHVEKKEYSYSHSIDIANQIIDAVSFCHSQHIVHCSLSSYSVFMVTNQIAKLGNFENSVELKTQESRNRSKSQFQKWNSFNFLSTSEGNLYKWLAPEIICDSSNLGTSVDVYGMAVIIWELFTGEMPNINRSYRNLIRKYSPPFDDSLSYRIPGNLLSILRHAFDNIASKRPSLSRIKWLIKELLQESSEPFTPCLSTKNEETDSKSTEKLMVTSKENSILSGHNESEYSTISNSDDLVKKKTRLNRKSISLNCLTRSKRDTHFPWTIGTYSQIGNKNWYRDIAAIPNQVEWKYPSPLTEVSIEGRGNLSNETHRRSITRGMKPASHHIGLSTSQTNICNIIETEDLIKSSSKGSLNKYVPSGDSSFMENCVKQHIYTSAKRHPLNRFSPLGSRIADLVKRYESSDSRHPYSSSNCSTPTADGDKKFFSPPSGKLTNKENISTSPPSLKVVSKSSKKFFPPLVNRQRRLDWSSTTDEENSLPKLLKSKVNIGLSKPLYFGDVTNKYH